MLYNPNMTSMLLGCLLKNPSLLFSPAYPLSKSDFSPEELHRVVFCAVVKLAEAGAQNITEVELDNFLKNYEAQYEIFQDSNGFEFVNVIRELSSSESYELYYNITRKFSLLRELKEAGYSITEYFDEMLDETEQNAKLNKWTIQEILDDIEVGQAQLRSKYDVNYIRNEIIAGDNVSERLDAFEERPAFGALLQSPYLSTIWNGWCRKHLGLRGGGSGSGKSRMSVGDLTGVGVNEIWNEEVQDFVVNDNFQSPTLFIATEQDVETEVEPMFWAAISGVEYRHIINGQCTKEEKLRVTKAGDILKANPLRIVSMPNFTCSSLRRKIKECVEADDIGYLVFDYMEQQADISQEYRKITGNAGRQDQVLLYLTSELKQMAEDFNVGILTSQQLNDSWKQLLFVDETALAGGKATKFKIDFGSIIIPTSYLRKDMKIIEPMLHRKGFGNDRTPLPNMCEFIFKGRYSEFGDQRIKLWTYFDKGTFQRHDYFVTNDVNKKVNVKKSVLGENV